MAQPFDFNTPITDNTTLVARYRCGDAPYAGKWFRITTHEGKQYVPQSLENAKQIFGLIGNINLINTATGIVEPVDYYFFNKIEFGGGWDGYAPTKGITIYPATNYFSTCYISGYAEGLVPANVTGFFNVQIYYSNCGSTPAKSIDYTGFKFDKAQWASLANDTNNGNQLFRPMTTTYKSGYGTPSGCGTYGVIEPLFPIDDSMTYGQGNFSTRGCNSAYSKTTLNYTIGTGFTGPYAQQWADKFPSMEGTYSDGQYLARKIYVA